MMDEALIERLYQELRPMARNFARIAPEHYDADDLLQLALIEIERVIEKKGRTDLPFLIGVARIEMKRAMSRVVVTRSLDAYLYNPETGYRRDIAAPPAYVAPQATRAQRHQILSLLAQCTPKQRAVLLASYGIESKHGKYRTLEGVCNWYGLTPAQFSKARANTVYRTLRQRISVGL